MSRRTLMLPLFVTCCGSVAAFLGRPWGLPDMPGLKLVDRLPPLGIASLCLFVCLFPKYQFAKIAVPTAGSKHQLPSARSIPVPRASAGSTRRGDPRDPRRRRGSQTGHRFGSSRRNERKLREETIGSCRRSLAFLAAPAPGSAAAVFPALTPERRWSEALARAVPSHRALSGSPPVHAP